MTFAADMDGAIVIQAHPNNIRSGANHPRVLVLHTPEEDADASEGTPNYFAKDLLLEDPPRRASTHYYISGGLGTPGDGDLYQMVPESQGAIANGVIGKPYPKDTNRAISLNLQSLNVELEGRAHNIHETMKQGNPQWETTVRWIESRSAKYNIPLDTQHVIGHKDVSSERSDPGRLDIDQLVRDAQALRVPQYNEEEDMAWIAKVKGGQAQYVVTVENGSLKKKRLRNPTVRKDLEKLLGAKSVEVDRKTLDLMHGAD